MNEWDAFVIKSPRRSFLSLVFYCKTFIFRYKNFLSTLFVVFIQNEITSPSWAVNLVEEPEVLVAEVVVWLPEVPRGRVVGVCPVGLRRIGPW